MMTARKPLPSKERVKPQARHADGAWPEAFAARTRGERRYWLIKSEPDVFSFSDLQEAPGETTCWDSVRNTSARNFMRDGMKPGDRCFFYHSNLQPSAIVGVCEVVSEGYPDTTALDPSHPYYDSRSDPANPTWFMVDVRAVCAFRSPVTLHDLKADPLLTAMDLIRVGRLSVVPVRKAEWRHICRLGGVRA